MTERQERKSRGFSVPHVLFVLFWFTGVFCSCFCLLAYFVVFFCMGGAVEMMREYGGAGGEQN